MTAPPPVAAYYARPRGSPLAVLALLLAGWCGARMMWWDYPLAGPANAEAAKAIALPQAPDAAIPAALAPFARYVPVPDPAAAFIAPPQVAQADAGAGGGRWQAAGRRSVMAAARTPDPVTVWLPGILPYPTMPVGAPSRWADAEGVGGRAGGQVAPAPFVPPAAPVALAAAPQGRWSLDGWTFWRQGSDSANVSQGRVPIYGASQAGAVLQFRIAPASGHDPRVYLRAYSAQVQGGESEAALGLSARPFAKVPLRVAGEARYTSAALFTAVRPAGYVVTELPPLRLPLGMTGEAYAQAGWVGGPGATWFADGQASAVRPVSFVNRLTGNALRMSIGAGIWAGAQKDAQRLDIGPTLRFDTKVGKVPTRVGVDWRHRVAGDASPGSGVAVTVSTAF